MLLKYPHLQVIYDEKRKLCHVSFPNAFSVLVVGMFTDFLEGPECKQVHH